MQRVGAVILGQRVFHPVEGERRVGDPVGIASHDDAEIGRVDQISIELVVAQDHVAEVAVLVRHPNRHNDAALSHGAHFHAL